MTRDEVEREFEVVWDGGEGLIPDRESKPNEAWTSPHRIYTKKSDYYLNREKWEQDKAARHTKDVDKPTETADNPLTTESHLDNRDTNQ